MRLTVLTVLLIGVLLCPLTAQAETIEKEYFHQLKVGEESRNWEHKIDLTDEMMYNGQVFVARELDLRMGKLVVVHEELTPMYYYVKVRLPKPHPSIPMAGKIKIKLTVADNQANVKAPPAPTKLELSKVGAALKPIFTWKTEARYAAITLYDTTTNQTVWERISTTTGYQGFDEGYLEKGHRYLWAVKVSDKYGKWSQAAQAAFKIDLVDGIVVAIPE